MNPEARAFFDEDVPAQLLVARDALLRDIRQAFPAVRPEPFGPLVDSDRDDPVRIAAAFADATDWTRLSPEWLDHWDGGADALCFLTNAAACFYLPAFRNAALTEGLNWGHPNSILTHGFDVESRDRPIHEPQLMETWSQYGRKRWAGLSKIQCRIVVRYLEWWIALNAEYEDRSFREAIDFYWRERAKTG